VISAFAHEKPHRSWVDSRTTDLLRQNLERRTGEELHAVQSLWWKVGLDRFLVLRNASVHCMGEEYADTRYLMHIFLLLMALLWPMSVDRQLCLDFRRRLAACGKPIVEAKLTSELFGRSCDMIENGI